MLPGEPTSESPHQVAETAETNDSNIFHAQTRRDEDCSGDESAILSEIEESSFTHCNCVGMIQNCCVPYWRRMICIFHVVRSIPLPTILTFFVTLSGWIIMRSRTTAHSGRRGNCQRPRGAQARPPTTNQRTWSAGASERATSQRSASSVSHETKHTGHSCRSSHFEPRVPSPHVGPFFAMR